MGFFQGDLGYVFHGNTGPLDQAFNGINLRLTGMGLVAARIGGELEGIFTAPYDAALEYNQTIANASAVTSGFGNDANSLRGPLSELAKQLGQESVFSAQEAADALVGLGRRGIDTVAAGFTGLKPLLDLAVATNADLTTSSNLVASALNAYGEQFTEAGHYSDVFTGAVNNSALITEDFGKILQFSGATASGMGVSIEELAATVGVLANSGINASISSTGLRRVLNELENPSRKLRERMQELGLTTEDISVRQNGLTGAIRNLVEAGFDPAKESIEVFGQRAGNVFGVLGAESFNLNRELVNTTDAIDQFTENLKTTNGVAEATANAMKDTLSSQVDILRGKWETLLITVGSQSEPIWKTLVELLNTTVLPALQSLVETVPGLGAAFQIAGGIIGVFLSVVGKVAITLGLMGVAFPAASAAISTWVTGVAASVFTVQALITALTGLGYALGALAILFVAWKVGSFIAELDIVKSSLGAVFDAINGLGAEAEAERIQMEEEFSRMSTAFSEYAEGMRGVRQAIADGDQELADKRLEVANQARIDLINNRIQELGDEKEALSNKLQQLEWYETGEIEATEAAIAQKEAMIEASFKAIDNLRSESYKEQQKQWQQQYADEEKAQQESIDEQAKARENAVSEEVLKIREANALFAKLLDEKSDFWREHVNEVGEVIWGDYIFRMDELTEAERVNLGKILNEDEVSLEKIHSLWVQHNQRMQSEFEREQNERERDLERAQRYYERYIQQLEQYNQRLYDRYVQRRSAEDSHFKEINDLRQTALELQEEWMVAMQNGWYEMANYAETEFRRVTASLREATDAQKDALDGAKEVLEEHVRYTTNLTNETTLQYKLLAAAAQNTMIDEINGSVFTPFVDDQQELMDIWDKLTKDQRRRILQYYEDIANGVGGSVKDIQDIIDQLNKSNVKANEDVAMSIEELEKRIAEMQDRVKELKAEMDDLDETAKDLSDGGFSDASESANDAATSLAASGQKFRVAANVMSGSFVAAAAAIVNTLGALKQNAREDMEELADIMAQGGFEAANNLQELFSGTGFKQFLEELASGADILSNPNGFLGDVNRVLGSLASAGGFALPDFVNDILGNGSSSGPTLGGGDLSNLEYLPVINANVVEMSKGLSAQMNISIDLDKERNRLLSDTAVSLAEFRESSTEEMRKINERLSGKLIVEVSNAAAFRS